MSRPHIKLMHRCERIIQPYGMDAGGPRLLCDEMLHRLGRWLRAAGYDTAMVAGGVDDMRVLDWAESEARLLVTRDRHLAERAENRGLLLRSEGTEANALELSRRLRIDWLSAAFTRCLVDNAPLRAASEHERNSASPSARELPGPWRVCPQCRRLYWPGSHVRRMQNRLEAWQARCGGRIIGGDEEGDSR